MLRTAASFFAKRYCPPQERGAVEGLLPLRGKILNCIDKLSLWLVHSLIPHGREALFLLRNFVTPFLLVV